MPEHKNILTESFKKPNMITWFINERCNFQCSYCFYKPNENLQIKKPIDLAKISEGFNHLNKEWQINITGGEPFLEKNFVGICNEITKKHSLSILTNLSTNNVFDFADCINPEKCLYSCIHTCC